MSENTTETKAIQKRSSNPVALLTDYLNHDRVIAELDRVLGERRATFVTSALNAVRNSDQLQKCTRESITSGIMVSAAVDLPVDPALQLAALVPYGNQAQFQIMWRGVVQLCLRTNQYADIQCTEIYRDELKSYNPITGQIVFHDPSKFKLRSSEKRNDGDVVGHYAQFTLLSGFKKGDYMTRGEAMAHARKYSKAYQYDLAKGKKASAWSTDPIPMGNKTILLRVLGKWGPKSVQLQKAIDGSREDFETAQRNAAERIAAETGSEIVDTEFEPNGDSPSETTTKKKTKKSKKKATATAKAEAKSEAGDIPQFKYRCSACEAGFDEPKMCGPNESVATCPIAGCGSLKVSLNPESGGTPGFMKDD